MRRAAGLNYPEWRLWFARRSLTVYPAVGDHEMGDNDWLVGRKKAHLVPEYRRLFAKYFTTNEDGRYRFQSRPKGTPHQATAYAFQHENVLVVTVDPHHQLDGRKGDVAGLGWGAGECGAAGLDEVGFARLGAEGILEKDPLVSAGIVERSPERNMRAIHSSSRG